MSSHARFVVAAGGIVAWLVLVQTSLVAAQGRRFQQPQMQLPQLETKGTVEGMVTANVIKINTDANQAWFLKISPEAKLEITGRHDEASVRRHWPNPRRKTGTGSHRPSGAGKNRRAARSSTSEDNRTPTG
jgi:hypothetical protein